MYVPYENSEQYPNRRNCYTAYCSSARNTLVQTLPVIDAGIMSLTPNNACKLYMAISGETKQQNYTNKDPGCIVMSSESMHGQSQHAPHHKL